MNSKSLVMDVELEEVLSFEVANKDCIPGHPAKTFIGRPRLLTQVQPLEWSQITQTFHLERSRNLTFFTLTLYPFDLFDFHLQVNPSFTYPED